jgi:hypothetical protein
VVHLGYYFLAADISLAANVANISWGSLLRYYFFAMYISVGWAAVLIATST